jgi:hypothetical protein
MLPQVRWKPGARLRWAGCANSRRGEQGIEDLKQRITTAAQGGIKVLTKGAQALKGCCVHAASMPKRAFLVYSSSPSPCCWLHGKIKMLLQN